MSASVSVNRAMRYLPNRSMSSVITADVAIATSVPFFAPFSTLSSLPAPMFCPANVVMAEPNENAGIITNPSILITMTLVAMHIAPKLLVRDWTMTMDRENIA